MPSDSVRPAHIIYSWSTFARLYLRWTDGAEPYESTLPNSRIAVTATMLGQPIRTFYEFAVPNEDDGHVPHESSHRLLHRLTYHKRPAGYVIFRHEVMAQEWINDNLSSPAFVVLAEHGFYFTTADSSDMALVKLRFTEFQ